MSSTQPPIWDSASPAKRSGQLARRAAGRRRLRRLCFTAAISERARGEPGVVGVDLGFQRRDQLQRVGDRAAHLLDPVAPGPRRTARSAPGIRSVSPALRSRWRRGSRWRCSARRSRRSRRGARQSALRARRRRFFSIVEVALGARAPRRPAARPVPRRCASRALSRSSRALAAVACSSAAASSLCAACSLEASAPASLRAAATLACRPSTSAPSAVAASSSAEASNARERMARRPWPPAFVAMDRATKEARLADFVSESSQVDNPQRILRRFRCASH